MRQGLLARLKTVRLELIDPAIAKCKGRIIKTTGDGMLVEFQSVTEALRCAVDFQGRMARRNRDMPASRSLLYRIGINLGDVIVEGDDIFGDGVNVAAQLKSAAEPGGICISAAVRDQVGDRLEVGYEDLGEQQVKNISRPIRMFKVLLSGQSPAARSTASAVQRPPGGRPQTLHSGSAVRQYQRRFAAGVFRRRADRGHHHRTFAVPGTSRHLPQRGFRPQGQADKGTANRPRIRRDYVVEGSVRKAADRVRVTVQLIDGETETHLWAERYDRKLEYIFAIQDEVTSAIAATLFGRVEAARHDRVQRKHTENMAAYEYVLTGKVLHHRSAREANAEALRMLESAIKLDPNYAHAHAWKACVVGQAWLHGWCERADATVQVISEECRWRRRLTTTTQMCIEFWPR